MVQRMDSDAAGLREMLRPLLEADGVLGGLVTSEDGLPLMACLRPGLDEEAVAAAGARIGQLARARLDGEGLEAGVLDGSRLKLVALPVSLGYLVLALDPEASTDRALELGRTVAAETDHAFADGAAAKTC